VKTYVNYLPGELPAQQLIGTPVTLGEGGPKIGEVVDAVKEGDRWRLGFRIDGPHVSLFGGGALSRITVTCSEED